MASGMVSNVFVGEVANNLIYRVYLSLTASA